MRVFLEVFVIIACVLSVLAAIIFTYLPAACEARWRNTPFASHWSFTTECLVEVSPGVWVSEASVKYLIK